MSYCSLCPESVSAANYFQMPVMAHYYHESRLCVPHRSPTLYCTIIGAGLTLYLSVIVVRNGSGVKSVIRGESIRSVGGMVLTGYSLSVLRQLSTSHLIWAVLGLQPDLSRERNIGLYIRIQDSKMCCIMDNVLRWFNVQWVRYCFYYNQITHD
jgi:hypothetical protein